MSPTAAQASTTDIPAKQEHPTRWKPGQSGNPKGRARKGHTLTEALEGLVDRKALGAALVSLAFTAENEQTRLAALKYIYDRIEGTPTQWHAEDQAAVRAELERIARDYGRPLEDVERDAEQAGLRLVK